MILILSGCSEQGSNNSESSKISDISEVSAIKQSSGTLRLWAQTPDIPDPLISSQLQWKSMSPLFYESLYIIDSDQKIGYGLASSDQRSADGLTYNIKIKSDVLFHDGTGLDADDIIYSWDHIRSAGNSPYKMNISNISSITAVSKLEVIVKLIRPDPFLKYKLDFPVIPAESMINTDDPFDFPPGTGPYFMKGKNGNEIQAVLFDDHRNADDHLISEIIITLLKDSREAMYMFGDDKIDMVLMADEMYETYFLRQDINIQRFPGRTFLFFQMNLGNGSILSDSGKADHLRSIVYAEDFLMPVKDSLVVTSEFPFLMNSGLIHTYNCAHKDLVNDMVPKYTEGAEQLKIIYESNGTAEKKIINSLTEKLEQDNIDYLLEKLDRDDFIEAIAGADYDIALRKAVTDGSPDFAWLYLSNSFQSFPDHETLLSGSYPGFDALRKELYTEYLSAGDETFSGIHCELLHKFAAEGPFIGIGFKINALALSNRIKGDLKPNNNRPYNNIKDVWVWLGY